MKWNNNSKNNNSNRNVRKWKVGKRRELGADVGTRWSHPVAGKGNFTCVIKKFTLNKKQWEIVLDASEKAKNSVYIY